MKSPIALFDSGKGGLTILEKIEKKLPFEDVIYFGDVRNMPYGDKPSEEVVKLTEKGLLFLAQKKPQLIALGCHTASCLWGEKRQIDSIPILSIVPATLDLVRKKTTSWDKIAILGTEKTITSNIYPENIDRTTISICCPLLAPLIEKGAEESVLLATLEKYLHPIQGKITHMLLACTHYGLIEPLIQKVAGNHIKILNPAENFALEIENTVRKKRNSQDQIADYEFIPAELGDAFSLLKTRLPK